MRLAEGEESCLLIRIHPARLGPLGSRRGRVEQLRSKSVDRHHARALVDNTHPHHTGLRRQNAPKEAWAKRAAQLTLIHMVNRTMSPLATCILGALLLSGCATEETPAVVPPTASETSAQPTVDSNDDADADEETDEDEPDVESSSSIPRLTTPTSGAYATS